MTTPHTPTATVIAGAVYIPSCAQPDRKRQLRVCAADEDAVTMAVEAGARALKCWSADASAVDALVVALHQRTAEAGSAVDAHVVREALGLTNTVRVVSMAGADALSGLAALQAVHDSTTLVIASEAAGGRQSAAAAALICVPTTSDAGNTVRVSEVARASELTHERWTGSDTSAKEPDYRFLAHRYQELTDQIVSQIVGADLGRVSQLCVSAPSSIDVRALWIALCGQDPTSLQPRAAEDRGVAGPLTAIVDSVLHRPSSGRGALYAAGSGQSVVVELTVPAGVESNFTWYESSVVSAPSPSVSEGPQLSFPLESPFFVRNWASTLRLEAASCTECGYVAFPPSQRPICPSCHARTWVPQELPREGHVYASMENFFLPAGFSKSLVLVLGELSNGFKYWAPMPPETRREDVEIGDPVRLVLRSITQRDGVTAYAMKFLPSDADAELEGAESATASA
ncbi:hypothetical protein [Mycobacterium sp.]|uniref:Zn-ribbon domain-containing OB-fold protein n=1 Tax=Mycobacterium sp. TaxID=1785 RepID=UPI003D0E8ADA